MSAESLFGMALWEARDRLQAQLDEGARCPCCEQYARRYRRKVNSAMARWLIALARIHEESEQSWVHVAAIAAVVAGRSVRRALELRAGPIGTGDYAKTRHWGLAISQPNEDPAKRDSGFWQLTARGSAFVGDRIEVPCYAVIYDNELQRLEGGSVSIRDALGRRFNYQELMLGL